MIDVKSEVRIVKGSDFSKGDRLIVKSHWNNDDIVLLDFGGIEVAVMAKDLKAAIENATNTVKW